MHTNVPDDPIHHLFFLVKVFLCMALGASVWAVWVPVHRLVALERTAIAATPLIAGGEHAPPAAAYENTTAFQIRYVPPEGRAVAVDPYTETVTLYEDGSEVRTMSVRHAPDATSSDAPPHGTYAVTGMVAHMVNTAQHLHMPHCVRFGGRYAFHGIPTTEAGMPYMEPRRSASYELGSEDARILYDFVATDTPVVVYGAPRSYVVVSSTTLAVQDGDLPATSARAYAVADLGSGQVLLDKHANTAYPIASVTKLMTALVAGTQTASLGELAEAPNGERYMIGDLFYPLLLHSDNSVAVSLAAHVGTNNFLKAMNDMADTLGMQDTSFRDVSGLSPRNRSTPNDLVLLARHLFTEHRYILDMSSDWGAVITSMNGVRWNVENKNKFAPDPTFVGGKLGYTDEAGQTSLAVFIEPVDGEPHALAIIVLDSHDWKQDTRTLRTWFVEQTAPALTSDTEAGEAGA